MIVLRNFVSLIKYNVVRIVLIGYNTNLFVADDADLNVRQFRLKQNAVELDGAFSGFGA